MSLTEMTETEQWLLATKSTLTPNVPDQRVSPTSALSPIASLQQASSLDSKHKMMIFGKQQNIISLFPFLDQGSIVINNLFGFFYHKIAIDNRLHRAGKHKVKFFLGHPLFYFLRQLLLIRSGALPLPETRIVNSKHRHTQQHQLAVKIILAIYNLFFSKRQDCREEQPARR